RESGASKALVRTDNTSTDSSSALEKFGNTGLMAPNAQPGAPRDPDCCFVSKKYAPFVSLKRLPYTQNHSSYWARTDTGLEIGTRGDAVTYNSGKRRRKM